MSLFGQGKNANDSMFSQMRKETFVSTNKKFPIYNLQAFTEQEMGESKEPALAKTGPELSDTQRMMYAFGDSRVVPYLKLKCIYRSKNGGIKRTSSSQDWP